MSEREGERGHGKAGGHGAASSAAGFLAAVPAGYVASPAPSLQGPKCRQHHTRMHGRSSPLTAFAHLSVSIVPCLENGEGAWFHAGKPPHTFGQKIPPSDIWSQLSPHGLPPRCSSHSQKRLRSPAHLLPLHHLPRNPRKGLLVVRLCGGTAEPWGDSLGHGRCVHRGNLSASEPPDHKANASGCSWAR